MQRETCWDSIVYCSATCRKPLSALDRAFEPRLLNLLSEKRLEAIHGLQHGKIMDPSFVKGRFYLRGKPNILETDLSEARKRLEKELIEETTKAEEEGKKGKKSKNPKYQSTWEVDWEEDGGRKVKGKKGRASIDR